MLELNESKKGSAGGSLGESAADKLSAEAGMDGRVVGSMSKHEFSKNSINIFDRVDADKNGVLSDFELSEAMHDKSYENEDAEAVSSLFQARKELANLNNEESPVLMMLKLPSDGVSKTDLYKFASIEDSHSQKMEQSSQTKEWLERDGNFVRVDTNADGKLSKQEIETASLQSVEGSDEYKAMKYMTDNYKDVCNRASPLWFLPDIGIEMDDMSTHTKDVYTSHEGQAIREVEAALSSAADKRQRSSRGSCNFQGQQMQ